MTKNLKTHLESNLVPIPVVVIKQRFYGLPIVELAGGRLSERTRAWKFRAGCSMTKSGRTYKHNNITVGHYTILGPVSAAYVDNILYETIPRNFREIYSRASYLSVCVCVLCADDIRWNESSCIKYRLVIIIIHRFPFFPYALFVLLLLPFTNQKSQQ